MDDKPGENKDTTAPQSDTAASAAAANTSEENSLESTANEPEPTTTDHKSTKKTGLAGKFRKLISHLNIYFLLFIFIFVLSGGIVFVAFQKDKKAAVPTTITTQSLSADTLSQLKDSEAKVGGPKQTLTIESNAIFSGKVLIRDSLDVAGTIKVGSSLSLPGISVSGTSNFDQIQANNLAIAGNTSIQGNLTVKNITATGSATFGGPVSAPSLTVQSLQLSGDLNITRHIDAGGATPSKNDGTALGNGGTASVSGTDTAGTITVNTGSSPAVGCFVTVSFVQKFGGTPHVVVTPIGSAAGGLNFYVTRTSSSFTVCSTNAAPAGQTFSFDYVTMD